MHTGRKEVISTINPHHFVIFEYSFLSSIIALEYLYNIYRSNRIYKTYSIKTHLLLLYNLREVCLYVRTARYSTVRYSTVQGYESIIEDSPKYDFIIHSLLDTVHLIEGKFAFVLNLQVLECVLCCIVLYILKRLP